MREEYIYNNKKEELVLVLLSDLYSELNAISVGISGPSFCPNSYYLLTT